MVTWWRSASKQRLGIRPNTEINAGGTVADVGSWRQYFDQLTPEQVEHLEYVQAMEYRDLSMLSTRSRPIRCKFSGA